MKSLLLTLSFGVFVPFFLLAQNNVNNKWEIGIGAGFTSYQGDVDDYALPTLKENKFAYMFNVRRSMGNYLALKGNLVFGGLSGNDGNFSTPEWRKRRAFSFNSPLVELSVQGEYYPFGLTYETYDTVVAATKTTAAIVTRKIKHRKIAPYLMLGVGGAYTKPTVKWNDASGNPVTSPDLIRADKDANGKNLNFVVPFGGGLRFLVSERIALGTEIAFRPTFSDRIDGISKAANPSRDDWYMTGLVTATYALRGCKDADNDGVCDKVDECPMVAGVSAQNGCPDSDGDGIRDANDACPLLFGSADFKGCPDIDGDGVTDNEDRCPTQKGSATNKGCPELSAAVKAKLALAIDNVKFETGKAVLLPTSLPVLDEIVYIMKNYPQYNLTIVGHTDNTGNTVSNQDLSERRALACFDYLVSKNVAADRMSHKGMGETQPIGDNNTPEGRETNRRVVFDLILR